MKKNIKNSREEIVIKVKNLSKIFRVPHKKIDSMKSSFINMFSKKTFEEFIALDNISFEIKRGEFVGIIGRNGSGKSTLLKILAGVYVADKGKVRVEGRISPFLELGIGFNPELSGRDNVRMNATILGLSKIEIDKKFDEIVEFSGIGEFIDQRVKNYSSGMMARLAFSVSIHSNGDILLMDEVLAVGDTSFQNKCMKIFENYKKEGKTVVLVTHDIGTVRKYCDRAIFIHDSKIEISGDVESVCDEYILKNMTREQREANLKKEKEKQEEERKEELLRKKELERQQEEKRKEELLRKKELERQQEEKRKEELLRKKELERQQEEIRKLNRIEEKQKKKELLKIKNEKAKIIKINFLNSDNKKKKIFQTGDDMIVRVSFKVKKNYHKKLNFGLAIFSEKEEYIMGINTFIDNIDTSEYIKNKYFDVHYKSMKFGNGEYSLKAGIWGEKKEDSIDFFEEKCKMKFERLTENDGLVDVDYNWG